jgi:hypothetical protein
MTGPRFKRYPAYTDSGVEWLGEIPTVWNTLKMWQALISAAVTAKIDVRENKA